MDREAAARHLLGCSPARSFERRVVLIAPEATRPYVADEWRDALVVIEQGQIELEHVDRRCVCLGPGAVLWLDRLPIRALRCRSATPAVLLVVSRRPESTGG